jgi:8-amino-7-oxononanoate synthase
MTEAPYRAYCEQRKATHQFRQLVETSLSDDSHAMRDGNDLISFAGNDYLGLSKHPDLIKAAQDAASQYGAGSTASRLITGNNPLYAELETLLAQGKGSETVLVMNSGYQANLTVIAALADATVVGKPVIVLADRLCHNSLLQGILLSGARLIRYRHNDYDHLQNLLTEHSAKDTHLIIVTESVFGMDGDRADLAVLTAFAEKFAAMLYVDEAHATGLYGPRGFGLAAEYPGKIAIAMGTFGKALGSFGAYIACSKTLHDYLIQRCGGLIYSTALPPAVLAASLAAIKLLPQLDKQRAYLATQSEQLRKALRNQGWDCGHSTTHIIPIILGNEEAATQLADQLKTKGILAPAIRPPTVPNGASRLRISLSAAHRENDIAHLIDVMQDHAAQFATTKLQAAS